MQLVLEVSDLNVTFDYRLNSAPDMRKQKETIVNQTD